MKKDFPTIFTFVAMLIAVFCQPDALFAQSSVTGAWKGIMVLHAYENDPIGVPGEVTISISYKEGKLQGTIRAGTFFFGEELYNINSQAKKFTASFSYRYAMNTVRAELLLTRDNLWMYGVIKLGVKIGATEYIKVYIKRQ